MGISQMTILLAGATGFLGSHLLKKVIDLNHQVIILKRSTSNCWRIDAYLSKVKNYDIDKTDLATVFQNHQVDVVINTVTDYGRKESKVSSVVDTNLIFGLKLLEEAANAQVKAFINTDTLLERNINSYALSKAQLVDWMHFVSNRNTKMVNIKIEHMYGAKDDENKFIYWLINQLKQNVKKIDLTSGMQKRDFIYIDDIVSAYEIIIQNIDAFSHFEVFELGTGNPVEVKSFVEKIYLALSKRQAVGTKLNFGAIAYRSNENMNMYADISKLKALGWSPKVTLDEGIKKIVEEEKK